tara:strand:- start:3048 stop:4211 length:1164 start_codon:yes stop_codon:yes gene_type:complete
MAKNKTRLCLTMIVKNESKIIKRCLDSVKDHIDYWVIVDTGSTDNTRSIIKKELSSIPGELHQSEFVNFSHNRNESLELSKGKAEYILLMDADLEFKVNNKDFKRALSRISSDCFMINECGAIKDKLCSGFSYRNKKIISGKKDWHFVGSTHEYIELKDGSDSSHPNFDEVWLHNRYDGGSKSEKYERDARLLEQEIESNPSDSRTMFYLGETYFNLFDKYPNEESYIDKSIYWYEKRSQQEDSWDQEVYHSLFKAAQARGLRYDYFDFEGFLKAYNFMPSRLEPIHSIVRHCRLNELYRIGYVIGNAALENIKPLPEDALFVDGDVYSYKLADEVAVCASWSGDNKTSCAMIESIIPIIENYISEEDEDRIKENLKICRNLLAENV